MRVRIVSKIFFYLINIMTTIGRVYKLTADGCDKCYVGSTKSPYVSIRMAHHRESGMMSVNTQSSQGCKTRGEF